MMFKVNGKTYRYLMGSWLIRNGKVIDSVKYEQVLPETERDEPNPIYHVPEKEFFGKIKLF